jgi:hypothetical protein
MNHQAPSRRVIFVASDIMLCLLLSQTSAGERRTYSQKISIEIQSVFARRADHGCQNPAKGRQAPACGSLEEQKPQGEADAALVQPKALKLQAGAGGSNRVGDEEDQAESKWLQGLHLRDGLLARGR